MESLFRYKDIEDISEKIDVCKIADYSVSILYNKLEGDLNVILKILFRDADAGSRSCLFNLRNGEQISFPDLTYEQQLKVPQDYLDKLKHSMTIGFEVFGQVRSVWTTSITTLNNKNADNPNFEKLPLDLPVPELKYYSEPKKVEEKTEEKSKGNIFTGLLNKIFKKPKKEATVE